MSTISIEELAVKLNGKMWVKEDLKRIYLDRGHNTKKMSTKTYVFEKDGEFKVVCNIDCPSQNYNWIDSQEEQVKESVYEQVDEILKLLKVKLIEARLSSDETEIEVRISYNGNEEAEFLTEEKFDERFNKYPQSVFDNLPQTKAPAKEVSANEVIAEIKVTEVKKTFELGSGKKVEHARFGLGEIIAEDGDAVIILFADRGETRLLKKFANLTYL